MPRLPVLRRAYPRGPLLFEVSRVLTMRADPKLVLPAADAYAGALAYARGIIAEWEDHEDGLRKLDESHPTRVAHGNDLFRYERLLDRAKDVLHAACGAFAFALQDFDREFFEQCRDPKFVRAWRAVERAAKQQAGRKDTIR